MIDCSSKLELKLYARGSCVVLLSPEGSGVVVDCSSKPEFKSYMLDVLGWFCLALQVQESRSIFLRSSSSTVICSMFLCGSP